jgi:hypothetical protein
MSDEREYVLWQILCTTCGFDGEKPVPAKDGLPTVDICRCPKCSKKAYTFRPFRTRHIIAELTKELVRMKLDIMDLQGIADGDVDR